MSRDGALVVITTDPTPPYEQLRRQLVDLIASGVLAPDERLARCASSPPTWAWP